MMDKINQKFVLGY